MTMSGKPIATNVNFPKNLPFDIRVTLVLLMFTFTRIGAGDKVRNTATEHDSAALPDVSAHQSNQAKKGSSAISRGRRGFAMRVNITFVLDESRLHFVESYSFSTNDKVACVGRYLRHHKYFDRERRRGFLSVERGLVAKFPLPLVDLYDPFGRSFDLHHACETSFSECLQLLVVVADASVYGRARPSGGFSNQSIHEMKSYPFDTLEQQFAFRLTASYYMCYYTLERHPDLKHFDSSCHEPGNMVNGEGTRRDVRAVDWKPFACALTSFCPDLCCGLIRNGFINDLSECESSSFNPCHDIASGQCHLDFKRNRDFHQMMQPGQLNYSCECGDGFFTDSFKSECVDINECQRGTYECGEMEACENTVGGYTCICRYGYVYDTNTQDCVQENTTFYLRQRAPHYLQSLSLQLSSQVKKDDSPLEKITNFVESFFPSAAPLCSSTSHVTLICSVFVIYYVLPHQVSLLL